MHYSERVGKEKRGEKACVLGGRRAAIRDRAESGKVTKEQAL